MFINPTRTNLLILKEKAVSVIESVGILKARRQALIGEFLKTTLPLVRSRDEIRGAYAAALNELKLCTGIEGAEFISSVEIAARREFGVEVTDMNVMGLRYRDLAAHETAVRSLVERGYDSSSNSFHLEECIYLFESTVDSILELASFESKLKRIGDEILRVTRHIRVLEERILPKIQGEIKTIAEYIAERDREDYYRMKMKKKMTGSGQLSRQLALAGLP